MSTSSNRIFLGQLFHDGSCIFDELYAHESARRDGIIAELMRLQDDELERTHGSSIEPITSEEINEYLQKFGGAHADQTLQEIYSWFIETVSDIDMHLSDFAVPEWAVTGSTLSDISNSEQMPFNQNPETDASKYSGHGYFPRPR